MSHKGATPHKKSHKNKKMTPKLGVIFICYWEILGSKPWLSREPDDAYLDTCDVLAALPLFLRCALVLLPFFSLASVYEPPFSRLLFGVTLGRYAAA